MQADHDLLVVGGGINGCALARDAAGRGASVLLVEKDDLASHTSSASTKLIHGGLRYLEHYEFRLVAEALAERERLMSAAPHLVRPLRFVLPHDRRTRPAWMIRLGLFLYDRLGGRQTLPRSGSVAVKGSGLEHVLRPGVVRAFTYSDCWGDDSRLVVANAQDAARLGATVRPRSRLVRARRVGNLWTAAVRDEITGAERNVRVRALVNAAGSWAGRLLSRELALTSASPLRLVKGSHIVTRRLFESDCAFMLQNPDRRVVFVLPYEEAFTLIGTTEELWNEDLDEVRIDEAEVRYLCDTVSGAMAVDIGPSDVLWSYSGLRPLYDDASVNPSAISRDYVLEVDGDAERAPVLSVFGGKITTHRALAEHALDRLRPFLPELGGPWTARARLPGGEFPDGDLQRLMRLVARRAPFLPAQTVRRWARSYGARAFDVLGGATSLAGLGEHFGAGLTEAEVDYLQREEWALTADDILWRRSKLGLELSEAGAARLASHLERGRRRSGRSEPQTARH